MKLHKYADLELQIDCYGSVPEHWGNGLDVRYYHILNCFPVNMCKPITQKGRRQQRPSPKSKGRKGCVPGRYSPGHPAVGSRDTGTALQPSASQQLHRNGLKKINQVYPVLGRWNVAPVSHNGQDRLVRKKGAKFV